MATIDGFDPKALSKGKSWVEILLDLSFGQEYRRRLCGIVHMFGEGWSSFDKPASTALFGERRAYRDPVTSVFALAWQRTFGERGNYERIRRAKRSDQADSTRRDSGSGGGATSGTHSGPRSFGTGGFRAHDVPVEPLQRGALACVRRTPGLPPGGLLRWARAVRGRNMGVPQ